MNNSNYENHHVNGTHVFNHKKYEKEFMPILQKMEKEHHLTHMRWTEECWIDSEGEQIDYVIKVADLSPEQAVDLSIELEEKMGYSLPINVTVRFSSSD